MWKLKKFICQLHASFNHKSSNTNINKTHSNPWWKTFFFFFKEIGKSNTEIWVSFPDRVVPSHPCPVPSFLCKKYAPAFRVQRKYDKTRIYYKNPLKCPPKKMQGEEAGVRSLFTNLNCPHRFQWLFCEQLTPNRMDYNTIEEIL